MKEIEAEATNREVLQVKQQLERISDQLCLAVKGDFNFTVEAHTIDESVQKLTMLLNFVIDTARRALSDVKEKNTKLTEMDKVKSDFMANVSHELRTPLTLILGPLETILADHSLPLAHRDNLRRMQRNATRLYVLVNDLLDFSKVEAGKFVVHEELLDVNQLISQLVDDAQGLAVERKVKMSFLPAEGIGPMLFDRKMLEKIVLNLMSNALKFTPAGGRIKVTLVKHETEIRLTVADTGVGIPASQIPKLFERFHQVDTSRTRAYEGTGIGLALINQFAQLMQGSISVESEEGKGSQFTVTLPIRTVSRKEKNGSQSQLADVHAPIVKVSLSQVTTDNKKPIVHPLMRKEATGELPVIVVADDNTDMRSYIVSLLEDSYEIIAVENGKLALEAIHKYQPQVVLSDVMMPIMDGYALTKAIKADPQLKNIPIILITAQAGKEAIVSGLEVGADDYLPKPFSPEELRARTASAQRLHHNFTQIENLNREMGTVVKELSTSKKILEESNKKLTKEVEERKKLEAKNMVLNNQLIMSARRAGMADISTSVLHNVGNVLNHLNTSVTMIHDKIDQSKISNLLKISKLLSEHQEDMDAFLAKDPQGQLIPNYIIKLADIWSEDKKYIVEEISALTHSVQHIKEIVVKQNAFSSSLGVVEKVAITDIIEDALTLNKTAYERAQIEIIRDFSPLKPVSIDRVKLLQIIVNLIKNSLESLLENKTKTKKISLRIQEKDESHFMIQVSDNGVGILPQNLKKMFSYGFTTKKTGHGFGLHVSAIAAQEMGGNFLVESQGAGKGATFTLTLPYQPKERKESQHDVPAAKADLAC
ncbi:MAG: luxQ [Alphaproteobacteria bacterium]|nr:luxQ [Alphaproteobacteria bacterium]